MYPPTHVAFAYVVGRKTIDRPISGVDVWLLIFFAVLPDLGDKVIHYQFGLFVSGRNVFHNIFIVFLCFGLYRFLKTDRWKRLSLIALIGLSTHFLGDLVVSLIGWTYKDYSSIPGWYLYVFFPFFDPKLLPIKFDLFEFLWELVFVIVSIYIWIRDGSPGLALPKIGNSRFKTVHNGEVNRKSVS